VNDQLTIDLTGSGRKDPVMAAREWIAANPAGWHMCLGYARELVAQGRRFGLKLIAERVRYECKLVGVPYALDNRIVSSLARFVIEAMPEAAELIETRDGLYVRRVETAAPGRRNA
jgi:hypothetical protein